MLNYSYTQWPIYCKEHGLVWVSEWVENFDQLAKAHNFTQAQVDIAVQCHLAQVEHLFTPANYTWSQRMCLVLWFIFGRKKSK